jgi:GTP-binding protein Era
VSNHLEPGEPDFLSGFVTLVGRPNVGKSTLLNRIIGQKVSIVSDRPQTTRNQIRGVHTTPGSQIIFLDTPGIHRPRTVLGERTNDRATSTLGEVDVVCMLVEASAPIGPGDRYIANLVQAVSTPKILIVNKVDASTPEHIFEHLAVAEDQLGTFDAYVPISGLTGENVDALLDEIRSRLEPGPRYYPDGEITDQPETFIAAEIVREKLLAIARDELPHSITVTVEEIEPDPEHPNPRPDVLALRATIRVERDSQKGIVIGKKGAVLKTAGTEARIELEALFGSPVYLETFVKVDKDWQRRPQALDRLGF